MPEDIARESKFQWLARFGFLTRGLLYVVIALLVIGTGRTEDLTGVMEYLSRDLGRWLMIFLTAGLTGYGAWRVCDAAFGMDSGRHHPKAWRRRIAAGASGLIYLYLAFKALRLLLAGHAPPGGVQQNAATALHLPAGELALEIAAAVLVGAAIVQLWKAANGSFLKHLDERGRRPLASWLGRIGYAARGVIFLTVGWLLARAGLDHSAAEAGGLDRALDAIRGPLQFPVAGGLLLFGLYSMIEARFRSIHNPPTEHIKRKVSEAAA